MNKIFDDKWKKKPTKKELYDLINCYTKEIERLKDVIKNKHLKEIERLNNIIDELEKDIKNLYTYGIKNNAEQKDYLLNRLQELKGRDK